MSRIGRKPIAVPNGVKVDIDGDMVRVEGPKGRIEQAFQSEMQIRLEDGQLIVERPSDAATHRAFHGLTRTLLANMVTGVTDGYTRKLEIVGVGYRRR